MKHSWTLLLLGASFFVVLTSMRTPVIPIDTADLKVEINALDDLKVQLKAQNATGKKLYLSVLILEPNAYHNITETEIYSEQFSGNVASVNRTLNLSNLETGTYQIRVRAGKKRFNRSFDIKAKPVVVPDNSRIISLQ